jgi:hypothetical protein
MDSDDDSGGGRWLTYGEIAAARGTSRIAAVRLTQRHKWRRQRGNDGHARVLVPPDMLQPERPAPSGVDGNTTRDVTADVPALLAAIETAHLGEVTALRGEIEALKKLADNAAARVVDAEAIQAGLRSRLTEAEGRAIAATSRAEQAEAERDMARADHQKTVETVQRLEDAEARLSKAETEAAAAGTRAEQAEARANQARAEAEEALQGAERLRQRERRPGRRGAACGAPGTAGAVAKGTLPGLGALDRYPQQPLHAARVAQSGSTHLSARVSTGYPAGRHW